MDKREILALRLDGRTYQQIATRAGISRQRVHQILNLPKAVEVRVRVVRVVNEFYTIQQVMSLLHVSDQTVYRYIWSGKLRAIRVGGLWRVRKKALAAFLKNKVVKGLDKHRDV